MEGNCYGKKNTAMRKKKREIIVSLNTCINHSSVAIQGRKLQL
jgi:hypothetical protein